MPTDAEILVAELARREMARRSFAAYLPYVHGETWCLTRMSQYIADRLQAFVAAETGHAYDIMVVETPPQHGKSMTVSETFPAWYLGRYPRHRVIEISYNDDSAQRFCRRNAEKIRLHGQTLFGAGIGEIDRATDLEMDNRVGSLISRGVLGGVTGRP